MGDLRSTGVAEGINAEPGATSSAISATGSNIFEYIGSCDS
jgi:hypothetical protein